MYLSSDQVAHLVPMKALLTERPPLTPGEFSGKVWSPNPMAYLHMGS